MRAEELLDLGELAKEHRDKVRKHRRLLSVILLLVGGVGVVYLIPVTELVAQRHDEEAREASLSTSLESSRAEAAAHAEVLAVLQGYRADLEAVAGVLAERAAAEVAAAQWAVDLLRVGLGDELGLDGGGNAGAALLAGVEEHRDALTRFGLIRDSVNQMEPVSPVAAIDEAALRELVLAIGVLDEEGVTHLVDSRPLADFERARRSFLEGVMGRAKADLTERSAAFWARARRELEGMDQDLVDVEELGAADSGVTVRTPAIDAPFEPAPGATAANPPRGHTRDDKDRFLRESADDLAAPVAEVDADLAAQASLLAGKITVLSTNVELARASIATLESERTEHENAMAETAQLLEGYVLPIHILSADSEELPGRFPLIAAAALLFLWIGARRLDLRRRTLESHLTGGAEGDVELLLDRPLTRTFRWPLALGGGFVAYLFARTALEPELCGGWIVAVLTALLLLPLVPGPDRVIGRGLGLEPPPRESGSGES